MSEVYRIFRKYSICGQLKYYNKFASKGKGPRAIKKYCQTCRQRGKFKNKLDFDVGKLSGNVISVRYQPCASKYQFSTLSLKDAIVLVEERVAIVITNKLIHLLYDRRALKKEVLIRDKYICKYCGLPGNTMDHVLPLSKGGLTTFSNCVCCCKRCNLKKGDLLLEEFQSIQTSRYETV